MTTASGALLVALEHHGEGRLHQAESLCRQILELQPDQPDVLHLLGIIAHQIGKHDIAIEHIGKAIALNGSVAEFHNSIGEAYRASGRVLTAISHCRRALALAPDYAQAHNSLGNALWDQGKFDDAVTSYRRALALKPDFVEGHYNLGNALRERGKFDEALLHCRHVLVLKPDFAEAHNNLANVLWEQGKCEDAVASYRLALVLQPDYVEAHSNLGNALREQGKLDEALSECRHALALKPDHVEAHNNLGNALRAQGRSDEAIACYRHALTITPAYAETNNNLGNALRDQGKFHEASAYYRRALTLKPDLAAAHYNLGLRLLFAGDFSEGFLEYEWRWKDRSFVREYARLILPEPFWDGSDNSGKTLLLYAEQGFGDSIQFIRYAPLVASRGGRVIVACQPELVRLFASIFTGACPPSEWAPMPGLAPTRPGRAETRPLPVDPSFTGACAPVQVVSDSEQLPKFDCHAPLLSLPRIFSTTVKTIPSPCPYITLPPNARGLKLTTVPGTKLKVGIVWAGRPTHKNDRNRSCQLSHFLTLAELPGIVLYSLQKQPMESAFGQITSGMPIKELGDQILDWADTAGLICQLDLVLTVDTGVAHLAGALGQPVWVLLPYVTDWRWITGRDDSPWYPTMRLFRQHALGDWAGVFAQVRLALGMWVESRAGA